jgi:hypothetical protein
VLEPADQPARGTCNAVGHVWDPGSAFGVQWTVRGKKMRSAVFQLSFSVADAWPANPTLIRITLIQAFKILSGLLTCQDALCHFPFGVRGCAIITSSSAVVA